MSTEDIAAKFEAFGALMERVMRWQIAIISLTACGVLWGARLEWNLAAHDAKITKLEAHEEKLIDLTANLKSEHALLKQMVESLRDRHSSQSNNVDVKVGAMAGPSAEIDQEAKRRGYYTTADVATLLKRAPRTVSEMFAAGRLPGAWRDEDSGSSPWKIPLTLMLGAGELADSNQPQTAAISRKQPQTAATMKSSLLLPLLLVTCAPREPEHFDKTILVIVKTEQPASSTVGSMIKPLLNFLIP